MLNREIDLNKSSVFSRTSIVRKVSAVARSASCFDDIRDRFVESKKDRDNRHYSPAENKIENFCVL